MIQASCSGLCAHWQALLVLTVFGGCDPPLGLMAVEVWRFFERVLDQEEALFDSLEVLALGGVLEASLGLQRQAACTLLHLSCPVLVVAQLHCSCNSLLHVLDPHRLDHRSHCPYRSPDKLIRFPNVFFLYKYFILFRILQWF